ncbi:hypothetical protein Tco_1246694 [Tanacetum coccineum]
MVPWTIRRGHVLGETFCRGHVLSDRHKMSSGMDWIVVVEINKVSAHTSETKSPKKRLQIQEFAAINFFMKIACNKLCNKNQGSWGLIELEFDGLGFLMKLDFAIFCAKEASQDHCPAFAFCEWIFWVGPFTRAAIAAFYHQLVLPLLLCLHPLSLRRALVYVDNKEDFTD